MKVTVTVVVYCSYHSVALHQHNVADYKGLHVAAGVNQLGRAERA